MSLPKRLLEDGSSLDRALLRAGREDEPSDELRRKVLGAMAFGGAAASAPRPSLLSRLARPRFFAIAGAAVVGGAAIFATVSGGSAPVAKAPVVAPVDLRDQAAKVSDEPTPAASVTMPDALPSAPPLALGPGPASTIVVPPDPENLALAPRIAPPAASIHHPGELPARPALSASLASPSAAVASNPASVAPTAATGPTAAGAIAAHEPAAASPLERETAALDAVKRQIDRGSAADALRALDAYEGEFPHGLLRPEAGALRVRALLAQGDRARATAVADELLARHPNSVHAKRIRALLADAGATNAVPAEK